MCIFVPILIYKRRMIRVLRMTPQINHTPDREDALAFFNELAAAAELRPDYRRMYNAMSRTFKRCLNQLTSESGIIFSGDFAKADFLLRTHGATGQLVKRTNDTRVRMRRRHELAESEMERCCMFDLKNLCMFIAFVYKTDIPTRLVAILPTEQAPAFAPVLAKEYMRVIVERWDADFIYVQTEGAADGELQKVCYAKGNLIYDYDWAYLKQLFYQNAQLNLIRPREDDGILYPELIILEPDYLVNISTVAHCFTNYDESAYVELIKKLEPQQASDATVLGNLAGLLLDESIHQQKGGRPYSEIAKSFFMDNALSLLSIKGGQAFHEEAQRQQQHIGQAISTTLPKALPDFKPEWGIVEPSFFSEMLGLQGRMDYLQTDFHVLMEQKSGKGAFPYDNFQTPRGTEEHLVQMMLYLTIIRYNYSAIFNRNKGVHAFLLYSKYANSLLTIGGAAPEMVFRAMKVRNELAWMELHLTRPNAYRLLERLTPEILNRKHVANKLWKDWQRPQLASILDPIRNASELERAYYFRFLTFVSNEHAMSKMGNKTKEGSGFAATWNDSLDEKREAGNIYDNLSLTWPEGSPKKNIKSVELRFSETASNDMSNFRVGDIVLLYPHEKGKEPDARRSMVLRCIIEDIQADTIRLSLRVSQADRRIFDAQLGKLWAIEHDFMESSYSSLYKGMQAFLSAPKERRDLLLLQRSPETNESIRLKGDYGAFNELALRVKQAKDMFLIIGPPGTGKTSYGMLNTVKEELLEADTNVLVLSYTNRAVDEICSKLLQDGIDFIRIGGAFSCAEAYRDKLLSAKVEKCGNIDALRSVILATRVFVGTTASLNGCISLFQLKQFSLAVIDEASQILEPQLIGLLSAHQQGIPVIRKFVMIGDHKQLPAVVQQEEAVSKVHESILNEICLTDCRQSMFERLLKKYAKDKNVSFMLRKQGRMHPDIALFPNINFYSNKLEVVPLPHQCASLPQQGSGQNGIANLLRTRRIAFIAAEAPKDSPSDKVNQVEANMIAALVVNIFRAEQSGFDVDKTVGVIVPYRNQIASVRNAIDRYGIPVLHQITIDTVERFQGSQRSYIIYGFTIQKPYQMDFLTNNVFEDETDGSIVDRKLNVAMTRAEEHLIMVGNEHLLSSNTIFRKLIEFVRDRNGFFRVSEKDFVAGKFEVPQ